MQRGPDWEAVRTFLALHRARTFAGAGELLGVHGSTASRRLVDLEDDLGVRLFERTPDGLVPTEAAERVLAAAEEAEGCVLAFGRDLEGWDQGPEGEVRVALLETMATHLVAPAVGALLREHPLLRLVLVPGAAVLDLTRREADIAVRLLRPARGDLVYTRAGSTQMAVFCHRTLAARLDAPRVTDLAWVGWDVHDSDSPDSRWLVEHVPADRFVFRSANLDVLLRAVAGGAGAGLLPREVASLYPELTELPVELPLPPPLPVWLVCHRAIRRVPRIVATWRFLEGLLSEHLGAP